MNPPPDDRYYPKYDPRRLDPEMEPGDQYGLRHDPDEKPTPMPDVKPDEDLLDPVPGEPTTKKKKKKRRLDENGKPLGEIDPKYHDKILHWHDDQEERRPWWIVTAIVAGLGALFCLIPIIVFASKAKQAGTAVAVYLILAAVVVMLVETVFVSLLMVIVGQVFQIDYGPVKEAVAKFAALTTFVNGLTFMILLFCTPFGMLMAIVLGGAVFTYLFRLNPTETFLSVGALMATSYALQLVIFVMILTKRTQGG